METINIGFLKFTFVAVLALVFFACQTSTTEVEIENGENESEEIDPDYTTIPLLIGTRGKFRPDDHENVVSSLIKAPLWVDGVYINIRMTSDGVPVLMHDATVDRTTDGTGAVNSLTLDQIQALNAGAGVQVPTLAEYLQGILDLETVDGRRPFSRIFLNPRDESAKAIAEMYAVAMGPQFESLVDRYTWQFGYLLDSDAGAYNLRALDDTVAIGTFMSEAANVNDMMTALKAVDGETILLWPGQYKYSPETLQNVADNDFEGGISRVSSSHLDILPKAHEDSNVKVLFTWHTDELSWWYPDE